MSVEKTSRMGIEHLLSMAAFLLFGIVPLPAETPKAEMTVIDATSNAVTRPLRDVVPFARELPAPAQASFTLRKPGNRPGNGGGGGSSPWTDPALQSSYPTTLPPAALSSFDGIPVNGSIPPDANIAAGAGQLVEVVNSEFAVYGTSATTCGASTVPCTLLGPAAIHTIFSSLTGLCGSVDGGDPIVLFDQFAQRWLISQLAYNSSFTSNFMCIGVSTSASATDTWNVYAFDFGSNLPDYPKFGVWPDAYYFSANMFRNGSRFNGAKACAFNRAAMLAGTPANGVCFQGTTGLYNILPANADGAIQPPAGEPNFYLQFVSNALNLWKFHVDFANTINSSFTGQSLSVTAFHQACGGGACIPQPAVTQKLDSLADRLMYRLSYRNFANATPPYESLLVNQSVQVRSSSNQTGIRWYEIRNPNGSPTVTQQSTFSPDPTTYRWMGTIAQDRQANIFLGYSASSGSTGNPIGYPSVAYTGQPAGTTANQMTPESVIWYGNGSQTQCTRWDDYSSVAVDASDDCTFWLVGEYLPNTGVFNWRTRIASFKFSTCGP